MEFNRQKLHYLFSDTFAEQSVLQILGWYEFYKGVDARICSTPVDFGRKALIHLRQSFAFPEHKALVLECVFGYLEDCTGYYPEPAQIRELIGLVSDDPMDERRIIGWFDAVFCPDQR